MGLHPIQGFVQLVEGSGGEWHRTSHLVVDAPAVQAHALEALLHGLTHQHADVIHLAASGQPMHDEQDGRVHSALCFRSPVQRHVAAIVEEQLLPGEFEVHPGLGQVVDRLQQRMGQESGRLELKALLSDRLRQFHLLQHCRQFFDWLKLHNKKYRKVI